MKTFMCLLAFGLAFGDKLDRTYLPPPGSKYAGGQPGDLQVPLEFPKESYTTTAPYTPGENNEGPSVIGGPQIVQGFAPTSGPGYTKQSNDLVPVTSASKPHSNFFGNSYKVPTTTTSYAFTQTTTFPPTESFDATSSPTGPGFSNDISPNQQPGSVNQLLGHGQFFNEQTGQYRPGFVHPGNQIVQEPSFNPTPTSTIPGILNSFPNNNNIIPGHPGYTDIHNINQYQQGFPTSTISPVPGSSFQPGFATSYNQGNSQHQEDQPPRQFIQEGLIPSTFAAPGYNYPSPNEKNANIKNTSIFGQQFSLASKPSTQQGPTQYIDKYGITQTVNPTRPQPSQQPYGGDLNSILGTTEPAVSLPQGPQSGGIQGTQTGLAPGQQKHTENQDFNLQQGYQSPEQYQGSYIPGNVQQGQNQNFDGQHPYLPGQGNQHLQYKQSLLDSATPKGTASPTGSFGNQPQPQQYGGKNTIYPSNAIPQTITPGTDHISQQQLNGEQPKFIGQQSVFPSNLSPEQKTKDLLQIHGHQSIRPTTGFPQEPTLFSQSDSQNGYNQPESIRQPFPTQSNIQPGFYQPSQTVIDVGRNNIPGYNALPDTDKFSSQPSVGQKPMVKNTYNSVVQNNRGTSTTKPSTALQFGHQQPFSSSTPTPGTLAPYGSTPGSVYASSTSSYPGVISPVIHERPQAESDRNAVILNYENILTPEGYAYSFDTANGIHADENGTTTDGTKANGSYSYIGDDGKLYSVVYTADENGFRPHGDHLPTPPPIPEGIQRVIEQAAKDKEAGISHDGFYDEAKYGHKKYTGHKNRHPTKQEKIINEADIPKSSTDVSLNLSGRKGEKKPLLTEYTSTNGDVGFNSKENIPKTDDAVLYPASQNKLSRIPKPNTRGKIEINGDQDEDLITGSDEQMKEYSMKQKMQQPFNDGSIKLSAGRKGKPILPKIMNQYHITRNKNDKKYDDNEGIYDNGSESDRRESSKTSDKNTEDINLPGRFSFEENSKIAKKQKVKRPGSSNPKVTDISYDLEPTISTENKSSKPSNGLSKKFGSKYYVTDKSSENPENYEEPSLSEDQKYFVVKPKNTTKKGSTKNSLRAKTYDDGTIEKAPSFEQQDQLPKGDSLIRNDYSKSSDNESGYKYIPPKKKLMDQEKNDMFSSRFSDTVTQKQPIMKSKTTVQPFITPNVHRDEDEDNSEYEDVSEENATPKSPAKFINTKTKPRKFTTSTTSQYESDSAENSDEQTEQYNEDYINSGEIKTRPEKIGPTRQPGYNLQQTTPKSEYDENISYDEENIPENKEVRNTTNRYLPEYSKNPEKDRPGTKYSQMNSRKSNYPYVSTTPKSLRKSNRPGTKRPSQQEEEQLQYTTTHEPTETSSTEEEYTSYTTQPKYTSKPKSTRPVFKLVKDDSLDSSEVATQPIDYIDEAVTSGSPTTGISESTFGSTPTSVKKYASSTVMPISKTQRPDTGNTLSNYYTKTKPTSVTFSSTSRTPDRPLSGTVTERPDTPETFGQFGQNLPSTTYRPNYSIMGISEPGSDAVDRFGRPLQTVLGTRQPASQFGYPETNLGTPSEQQKIYQDSRVTRPRPGSVNTFKPTESRFGVQTTPGTKPAIFGPSSTTTSAYLSPYGQPTDKVIGEDFSGPKQQQKFDPETGYYY